ncbi:hypothetical protein [Vampirovibrio chlorellavorus]|uniref:hypothetical protein n=1 Tax=Vampirovibrio chlorellavorus TaxID=758823 RepID=UPI0026F2DECF|nr:hypothetical protein [Vampirovibrio chlorellavorus]
MITLGNALRFGGHHSQETLRTSRFLLGSPVASIGSPFGSDVSLSSRRSESLERSPRGERKPAVRGELTKLAYQQAIHSTQAYMAQTLKLVNMMNIAAMQGKETHQSLLTRIRSTEMDAHGADMILNDLNRTSEAFDDLQQDLQRLVQSHHQLVKTVRQDPRFDRKA